MLFKLMLLLNILGLSVGPDARDEDELGGKGFGSVVQQRDHRRAPQQGGVMSTRPGPTTQRGCLASSLRPVPAMECRLGAGGCAVRAHAARLLDEWELWSGRAAEPDIGSSRGSPVEGRTGAVPRVSMHQPSISPVGCARTGGDRGLGTLPREPRFRRG